ncbi:rap guanine nucleotide exchange factor 1-like isoform X3 [Poecilia formosa]|uniref:rap guanine nucleotide exchange factor 1-like isoform X1 n=1 Tax=Poecilia formosa TaxID=48698 RepID=UPI0007B7CF4D|nr:PREDICTED: rap guanine nucleotide exchange factor 1-like isoform X1 [Poecilia formosa]XP_016519718.1 PREDICTED: rap guanine nucleotide exchange factor 1-like isoform X2 [Poecilia formosa]XP_016519719.1 PREDICTED: rap guanine nucleotide exchange factor 1-like isoform X3 [Poecilia formosa]
MSSRSDSKSASQIVFLTMKLKDRLHPQRNRTRAKPPDLDLSQNPSAILVDQERAVLSSLQYFKALVDRLDLDRPAGHKPGLDRSMVGGLVGGASTGILEAVQALVELEPDELDSKTVSARLACLYGAVAQLIRWADRVMLQGVSHDDGGSSESVTTVIRGVLNSAKELVRLVAERREGSAPLSPVQSQSRVVEDQEMSTRTPPCPSTEGRGEGTETKGAGTHAPPKPPMPVPEPLPQATPPQESAFSPPALPPKRRQTPPLPVPAHCKVAIVTPIIRQPEEDLQVEDDSCCKRLSSSSADSAANTSPSGNYHTHTHTHTHFLPTKGVVSDITSSQLPLPVFGDCCPLLAVTSAGRYTRTGDMD